MRASGVKDKEMAREGYKLLRKFGNSKSRSIAKPKPTPSGGFGVSTEKSVGGTYYADDLVIWSVPGQGKQLRERLSRWLQAKGLSLNERKTRIVNFREEGFHFLG